MVISENCCNFIVQIKSFTNNNRYDHRGQCYGIILYCRRFLQVSKSEVMLIMILFHDSGYRCLKHFYLESVCKHMRHLFPRVVSYNRFVELERDVAAPLALFVKKVLLGKCTGVSFVDSTPLRVCRNHFDNFVVNMLGALAAYCCFPKTCINFQRTLDTQLALF